MGTFIETPLDTPFTESSTAISDESKGFLNGAFMSALPENSPPEKTFSASMSKDMKRSSRSPFSEAGFAAESCAGFAFFFFLTLAFWTAGCSRGCLGSCFLPHAATANAAAISSAIFKILGICILVFLG